MCLYYDWSDMEAEIPGNVGAMMAIPGAVMVGYDAVHAGRMQF